MILCDVNVLVYAFREDANQHQEYNEWLAQVVNGYSPYGVASIVLSGFVRIVTHPKIFKTPTPVNDALAFANIVRNQPNAVAVEPGERHWEIFEKLCRDARAKGNLVPDAYIAALAIESGCTLLTTDGDFGRFRQLKWQRPL